ncbi:IclR family transcriptional regulator [Devosia psychrophila]|uniref:IclR family transcriptional regulator n=1 Tax=Devosia psychrophila TaxID=728005 RepID=A0A0F5PXH1_9HYPH|nr:IclR family transcriptional regulator [Devosia psychrophila]KKC33348.1 IclR family transcriptional regulator [Devosia psychrophila]SFC21098.1 transcriptional regulator, IclR family [Devosia psychrophila]
MAIEDDGDRYRAPALDKGLDILELLAATPDGLSQAEIAKALNRSPNEIYRMLDRLVRRDYVRRTPEDRYEITLKLFEMAHARPPMHRLISQATPVLRRFSLKAEQAVHLVVRDRNILVVVAQVDGPGYWNVSIRVGSRIGLVNTGSGHVFLAFATSEERALMLEAQGLSNPEAMPKGLETRLTQIAEQGYESMPSAQTPGVFNLSVPVFGPMGSVLAVITSPYTQRLDKYDAPNMQQALELIRVAGHELSRRAKE